MRAVVYKGNSNSRNDSPGSEAKLQVSGISVRLLEGGDGDEEEEVGGGGGAGRCRGDATGTLSVA